MNSFIPKAALIFNLVFPVRGTKLNSRKSTLRKKEILRPCQMSPDFSVEENKAHVGIVA